MTAAAVQKASRRERPQRSGDRGGGRDIASGAQSARALFDRSPPHSLEAEMALLGSFILDPSVLEEAGPLLGDAQPCYAEHHNRILAHILRLYHDHADMDVVQLAESLRDEMGEEEFARVQGAEYLVQLAESVPTAVNAPYYAKIVAEKARLRRLIDAASRILFEAYHAGELGPGGAQEVLDLAEEAVFAVTAPDDSAAKHRPQKLAELLQTAMERIEAADGLAVRGLATGWRDLDAMLSGLHPGEMVIVGARPSMGKTALALNIAERVAMGGHWTGDGREPSEPVPVAFFSMEMGKDAITERLIARRSGVSQQRLRTGNLHEEHYRQIVRACGELSAAPVHIDDTPAMTVLQLRSKARRLRAQHRVGCVVIDYLQLMTAPGQARENRQVEVSAISRQVKALARELNVPVVCLAQLNRGSESGGSAVRRPRMSDLRESGSIEQDADVIVLLHREAYYHQDDPEWLAEHEDEADIAELIVCKQRNGPTGTVRLRVRLETGDFRDAHDFRGSPFGPVPRGAPTQHSAIKDDAGDDSGGEDDDTGGLPV